MSYIQPLVGYPGLVWCTCWQAMTWLQTILNSPTASTQTVAAGAQATYQTLRNGINWVGAYQTASMLQIESSNLTAVADMALILDPLTSTYISNRINATRAAASGLTALIPAVNPWNAVNLLNAGQPAVSYYGTASGVGFLEWCGSFTAENPPPHLGTSGLVACAAQEAAAWIDVATTIQIVQGAPYLDYRYDAAVRTYRTSNRIANILSNFQSGPFASGATATPGARLISWNGVAALPAMLLSAASLYSAPASLALQQASVVRFDLGAVLQQLGLLLLSLRGVSPTAPGIATLNVGQSLQDMSAQRTGNFENWSAIAALNGLQAPYPGGSNNALALAGTQFMLPPAGGGPVVTGVPVPTYAANTLGTDWDFGPINGSMPPWLGDIPLITGYLNFARAIGRRLQTPLGTLIYHTNYGSRIPPEVGATQGAGEAPRLARLGVSAIESDPRTAGVSSVIATVQPGFLATFAATVTPIGPGVQSVNVNETIGPPA